MNSGPTDSDMVGVIYWDTSALLKLYAPEADSNAYTRQFIGQQEDLAISYLHWIEMYYAFQGKETRGEIAPGSARKLFRSFESHVEDERYVLIPWGSDVAEKARWILDQCSAGSPPVTVRTLDGLHLGALFAAGIEKVVTADIRMRQAASILGIQVMP